jgi:polar amino acid transport system substrate-binding protein
MIDSIINLPLPCNFYGLNFMLLKIEPRMPNCHSARIHIFLFAAIVGACLITPASALEINTEENIPFTYLDSQQRITGISTDIVLEMGRRANIPMTLQMIPWARAFQSALSLPNNCVYSAVRLPERETLFKWVGPISFNKWAFFAKSDFNKTMMKLDDARPYRIGSVLKDSKQAYLKSQGFTNFEPAVDDKLNLSKLIANRIDLWIAGLYKGKELIEQAGVKNVKPIFIVREVEYYLACHPSTPDSIINTLNQTLITLQKEGFTKSVTDRHAEYIRP